MTTFVSVGNATQPFDRLLEAILRLPSLPQPVIVQHGHTRFDAPGFDARAFLGMAEFGELLASADLLILHAGAGSVIHAVRAGKIPVVMPRRKGNGEIVDDHQVEFGRALADTGKVVLAEGPDQLVCAVEEALRQQAAGRVQGSEPPLVKMIGDVLGRCESRHKDAEAGKSW